MALPPNSGGSSLEGLTASLTRQVTEEMSAHRSGVPGAHVLSSPTLGLLFELASLKALEDAGSPPVATLGVGLAFSHEAPTPVGFEVTVEARLVEARGRRLSFEVAARDELEAIGRGTHERVIVDWDRVLESIQAKKDRRGH